MEGDGRGIVQEERRRKETGEGQKRGRGRERDNRGLSGTV